MILSHNIVPSLCCIHNGLKDQGVKFNTMTYAQYKKLGKETAMKVLADRSFNNIKTIHSIIKECAKNKWNYRIGSNVFPLMTHPDLKFGIDDFYNFSDIISEFSACATTIKQNKVRCSMHPDQFVVPASPKNGVAENSIRDLEQHAMIMDLLQLPQSYEAPINIHMNCYNDAKFSEVVDRLEKVLKRMSKSVTSRLVFENEDKLKSWTVYNLHEHLYKRTGIPITFDNLHNKCNPSHLDEKQALALCLSTWPEGVPAITHYSDSRKNHEDPLCKEVAHSDWLYEKIETYGMDFDIELEVKMKEKALFDYNTKIEKILV